MKKLVTALLLVASASALAQVPQGINYQAIIRNANNQPLLSASVGLQIAVRQSTANGTIVYQETFNTTTNANGLINLVIGQGIPDIGTFNTIDWSQGPYFVEIGSDVMGGSNYVSVGIQQLMSVPYALFAETSNTPGPQGPQGIQGPQGAAGIAGQNGQNGVSIISSYIQNDSLYVSLSNGQILNTGYVRGPQGVQGPAGMNGIDGATGPQGPIGLTGATGPQGIQGPAGVNGIDGATGPQGPIGLTGATGPQGIQGPAGMNGIDGATGPQGPIGLTGATGPQGIQGPAGVNGIDGATGPQGPAGANGVGITSTVDNGNGTITFNYSNGTSFTTGNLSNTPTYQIGDTIYGGRIFYIDETGEHGLIYHSFNNMSTQAYPYDAVAGTPSTLSQFIGGGEYNSQLLTIANPNNLSQFSSVISMGKDGKQFSKYHLPSLYELTILYNERLTLGISSNLTFATNDRVFGSCGTCGRRYLNFGTGAIVYSTAENFQAGTVLIREF